MYRSTRRVLLTLLILCMGAAAWQLVAVVPPERGALGDKEFQHPGLAIQDVYKTPAELPPQAAERALQAVAALGADAASARVDDLGGRFETLLPSHPLQLLPRGKSKKALVALENSARNAVRGYLRAHGQSLRIDSDELATATVAVHGDGEMIQLHMQRYVGGVEVRGSFVSAAIRQDRLTLLGIRRWGDVHVSRQPQLSADDALAAAEAFLESSSVTGRWGKSGLVLLPMETPGAGPGEAHGRGYVHRLAWALFPQVDGEDGWEVLIDAHNGEALSFTDTRHFAEVKGGVLPVSNDGVAPDGVEQAGWPMPFDVVQTPGGPQTTDAGGNLPGVTGSLTSNLAGQFIRMSDSCGAISLTQNDNVDFGASPGTDCVTPGFGGAGNTHASRTGFHELNRIKEMGRGQLPSNSWLQAQLTSNMNLNSTCNAFWNGATVNFYRSGGGCANTGELAGVFDHEWGHGMDANDATPGVSNPGEGIADIYTALRLNNSCIGRNFRPGVNCGGYGDPCLNCTGVRDIDFANRQSGQPHDFTWSNANCGGGVHCRGGVYAEAVWDLWHRKLSQPPYNMDNNTALELTTRLTYIGAGGVGTWFSGSPPFGGCSASGGYLQYLIADDDDTDTSNGTPHMTAIFNAFNDHEIACNTPPVVDSGCANTPATPPVVTATPTDRSASLSWGAVADATKYQVFRTDGVFQCDFGKIKVGETAGTSFNDTGLQNGRQYSYVVIPIGAADTCMGPASLCANVSPASGPNLDVDTGSASLAILTGDGDEFLDNCEDGRMRFDVVNSGLGTLTNARIVGVTPTSHPATTVTTTFPSAISPSTLGEGAAGSGSFDFIAGGLAFNDTLVFQVEVTADQLTVSKFGTLTVSSAESDFQTFAAKTFSFEADLEDWAVAQGTWNRSSAIGGGGGTTWAVASSNGLHNQCDRIRSPILRLQATSTLALDSNFDIEPFSASTWYDRANVGLIDSGGARSLITPDGGRLYNADSNGPGNYSGCNDPEEGWAGLAASWAGSSWSSTALQSGTFAGQDVQLEVIYATDPALANRGFSFDQVTVTDVDFQVADGQSDSCPGPDPCTVDADCDNGVFCDGAEVCNASTCEAGTPVDCNDGVGCTADSCNEATDSCDNVGNDAACDNGLFCDGVETCDVDLDCQAGTPVDCNDAVGCTIDICDEGADSCDNTPDDNLCDNGLFCDGAETCDVSLDCQAGSDPCPGIPCDEVNDVCVVDCDNDGVCESGEDCNSCADCPTLPLPGGVCGNGLCEAGDGEDCTNCATDCNGVQGGKPANRFCCGFGGNTPVGCGDSRCTTGGFSCTETPTGGGGSSCCGDLVCEGQEDNANCGIDCPCGAKGAACSANSDCCSGACKSNGTCR